jgi:hypothetical protein
MRSSLSCAIGLACVVGSLARPALAGDARDTAAVVAVEVKGATDAAGEMATAVREALAEQMALVPVPRVTAALVFEQNPACSDATCLRRIGAALGARWLLRARVESVGSDYDLEVNLADGRTGRELPPLRDRCTLCGWAEVGVRLSALTRACVSLATVAPPGAEPSTVAVPAPPPKPRGKGLAAGKWIAAVAAVGLLGSAAAMFAINGRGTCSLPSDVPGYYQCPRHYDTNVVGGVLLGAGALATAASATLFWLDFSRDRVTPAAQHATALTVGVTHTF